MLCSSRATRNEKGTMYCVSCGAELRKIQTPSVEVPPLDTGGAGLSAGPAGPGASVPNMPNYPVQAVLLTLVCFVLSPFTLFFPSWAQSRGSSPSSTGRRSTAKVAGNNYAGARESSHMRRTCVAHGEGVWTWITLAFAVLELLILAAFCSYSSSRWPRGAAPPSRHALKAAGPPPERGPGVTFAVSPQSQGVYSGASRTGRRTEGRQR